MPKEIEVKSILNKKKRRDSWFLDEYTLNLYSACAFNCLYCYIRGSKFGENLAKSLSVKANAIPLLEKQLAARARKGQFGYIVVSSATDPYLGLEEELQLTRQALAVIAAHRFPVHMITKSPLILRDLDLLEAIRRQANVPADLAAQGMDGVIVSFSFSSLDDEVGAIFEPGAPSPTQRLDALRQVAAAGFRTGVSLMPLLPFISDTAHHLGFMLQQFKAAGARYLLPSTLTLFGSGKADSKTLTLNAVQKYYPHLLEKYARWFAEAEGMPAHYQAAFMKKIGELCVRHGISPTIVGS